MSLNNIPLTILDEVVNSEVFQSQTNLPSQNICKKLSAISKYKPISIKGHFNSRSSDSGKSSSCSPVLLDCSFDSGIAGVLPDDNEMQLHKRIQQCQCILLALERDQEYFLKIRNRLSKITNRKQKVSNETEFFCNVCCTEVDANDEKTYVRCYICKKYICRNIKCANWLPKTGEWECDLCKTSKDSLAQTSSWVAEQITFNQEKIISPPRARSEIYIPISEYNDSLIHFESVSQTGANSNAISADQKVKIREYVEEVVAKLLGGNLDTVAVNQLSKSETYLSDSNVNPIRNGTSEEAVPADTSGHDLSNISETRLRQMIQKIIAETISLPPLANGHAGPDIGVDISARAEDNRQFSNRHRTAHYFEPTIYQDLLATAVLNKIVDKQLKNIQSSTERETETGGDDLNGNLRHTSTDQNYNADKRSTSSGSSVEPHSDCSYPEVEQVFNNNDDKLSELLRNSDRDSVMSDYLANHMIPLPELNAIATESEEDDYTSVTSSAVGDETWEKNWLFKKKKSALSGSVTTSSIGMLVPDPKEDVRAQIGDKTADEVSDLSELGSDSDESLKSLRSQLEPINDRLVNKHLIGGQNNKMILDELIERSSIISDILPNDTEPVYTDACNEHLIDAKATNEAVNNNVSQQQQQKVHEQNAELDLNSNSLTASDDMSESDGCTGFSAVEIFESSGTPSVVEILAAMALGPMLAVPSIDQPIPMTVSDINVLTELKELALAEIKAHALELTPRNLDVIPEESGEVTNQQEISSGEKELDFHFQEREQLFQPPLLKEIAESQTKNITSPAESSSFSESAHTTLKNQTSTIDEQLKAAQVEEAALNERTEKSQKESTKYISDKSDKNIEQIIQNSTLKNADHKPLASVEPTKEGKLCEEFINQSASTENILEEFSEMFVPCERISPEENSATQAEISEEFSKEYPDFKNSSEHVEISSQNIPTQQTGTRSVFLNDTTDEQSISAPHFSKESSQNISMEQTFEPKAEQTESYTETLKTKVIVLEETNPTEIISSAITAIKNTEKQTNTQIDLRTQLNPIEAQSIMLDETEYKQTVLFSKETPGNEYRNEKAIPSEETLKEIAGSVIEKQCLDYKSKAVETSETISSNQIPEKQIIFDTIEYSDCLNSATGEPIEAEINSFQEIAGKVSIPQTLDPNTDAQTKIIPIDHLYSWNNGNSDKLPQMEMERSHENMKSSADTFKDIIETYSEGQSQPTCDNAENSSNDSSDSLTSVVRKAAKMSEEIIETIAKEQPLDSETEKALLEYANAANEEETDVNIEQIFKNPPSPSLLCNESDERVKVEVISSIVISKEIDETVLDELPLVTSNNAAKDLNVDSGLLKTIAESPDKIAEVVSLEKRLDPKTEYPDKAHFEHSNAVDLKEQETSIHIQSISKKPLTVSHADILTNEYDIPAKVEMTLSVEIAKDNAETISDDQPHSTSSNADSEALNAIEDSGETISKETFLKHPNTTNNTLEESIQDLKEPETNTNAQSISKEPLTASHTENLTTESDVTEKVEVTSSVEISKENTEAVSDEQLQAASGVAESTSLETKENPSGEAVLKEQPSHSKAGTSDKTLCEHSNSTNSLLEESAKVLNEQETNDQSTSAEPLTASYTDTLTNGSDVTAKVEVTSSVDILNKNAETISDEQPHPTSSNVDSDPLNAIEDSSGETISKEQPLESKTENYDETLLEHSNTTNNILEESVQDLKEPETNTNAQSIYKEPLTASHTKNLCYESDVSAKVEVTSSVEISEENVEAVSDEQLQGVSSVAELASLETAEDSSEETISKEQLLESKIDTSDKTLCEHLNTTNNLFEEPARDLNEQETNDQITFNEPLAASYTDNLTNESNVTAKVEVIPSIEISEENAETISDEQPHPTSSNAVSEPMNAIEDSSEETILKKQPLDSKSDNSKETLLEHSNTTNNTREESAQDLKEPETNTNAQSISKEPLAASHTETLTNESDVTAKVEVTLSVEISKENTEAVSDEQLQAASGVAESTSLETEENPSGEAVLKEQPSHSKASTSDKTLCEHSNSTNSLLEESAKVLNEQETNDQSTSTEHLTASYTDTWTNGSDVTAKVEVTSSVEISKENAETISDEQQHPTSSNADSDPLNAIEDSSGETISKEQPLESKTENYDEALLEHSNTTNNILEESIQDLKEPETNTNAQSIPKEPLTASHTENLTNESDVTEKVEVTSSVEISKENTEAVSDEQLQAASGVAESTSLETEETPSGETVLKEQPSHSKADTSDETLCEHSNTTNNLLEESAKVLNEQETNDQSTSAETLTASYTDTLTNRSDVTAKVEVTSSVEISKENAETVSDEQQHPTSSNADSDPLNAIEDASGETISKEQPLESKTENYDETLLEHSNTTNNTREESAQDLKEPETNTNAQSISKEPLTASHTETLTNEYDVTAKVEVTSSVEISKENAETVSDEQLQAASSMAELTSLETEEDPSGETVLKEQPSDSKADTSDKTLCEHSSTTNNTFEESAKVLNEQETNDHSTSAEPLTASYTDTLTNGSDITVKVEVTSSVEISKENAETISDAQPHPTSSNADSDPLNAIEDSSGETISKEQPLESKTENYDEALLEHSNTTNNIFEGSVQDLKQPETNTNAQSIYKEPLTASHTETLTNESDVTAKVEVTSSVEISKENAEAVSDEQLQAASSMAELTSLETEEDPSGETVLKEQHSDSKADTSDKTLCEHSNTTNNTFEESAKDLNEQETNDQSTSAEPLTASYTDTLTNGSDVTAKVEVTSSVEISKENAETISDEQPHPTSSNADSDPLNAIEDSSGETISKEQPLESKTENYDEALLEHSNTTNNILEGSVQDLKQPETNTNAQSIYKEPLTASHTETFTNESDVTAKVEVTSSVEISKENAEAVSDEQLQAASSMVELTSLETEEAPSGETISKEQPLESKTNTSDKTLYEYSYTTDSLFEESAKDLNEQETNGQSISNESLVASNTDNLPNESKVTAKVEVTSSVEISKEDAERGSGEHPHATSSNADAGSLKSTEDAPSETISKELPLVSENATNKLITESSKTAVDLKEQETNTHDDVISEVLVTASPLKTEEIKRTSIEYLDADVKADVISPESTESISMGHMLDSESEKEHSASSIYKSDEYTEIVANLSIEVKSEKETNEHHRNLQSELIYQTPTKQNDLASMEYLKTSNNSSEKISRELQLKPKTEEFGKILLELSDNTIDSAEKLIKLENDLKEEQLNTQVEISFNSAQHSDPLMKQTEFCSSENLDSLTEKAAEPPIASSAEANSLGYISETVFELKIEKSESSPFEQASKHLDSPHNAIKKVEVSLAEETTSIANADAEHGIENVPLIMDSKTEHANSQSSIEQILETEVKLAETTTVENSESLYKKSEVLPQEVSETISEDHHMLSTAAESAKAFTEHLDIANNVITDPLDSKAEQHLETEAEVNSIEAIPKEVPETLSLELKSEKPLELVTSGNLQSTQFEKGGISETILKYSENSERNATDSGNEFTTEPSQMETALKENSKVKLAELNSREYLDTWENTGNEQAKLGVQSVEVTPKNIDETISEHQLIEQKSTEPVKFSSDTTIDSNEAQSNFVTAVVCGEELSEVQTNCNEPLSEKHDTDGLIKEEGNSSEEVLIENTEPISENMLLKVNSEKSERVLSGTLTTGVEAQGSDLDLLCEKHSSCTNAEVDTKTVLEGQHVELKIEKSEGAKDIVKKTELVFYECSESLKNESENILENQFDNEYEIGSGGPSYGVNAKINSEGQRLELRMDKSEGVNDIVRKTELVFYECSESLENESDKCENISEKQFDNKCEKCSGDPTYEANAKIVPGGQHLELKMEKSEDENDIVKETELVFYECSESLDNSSDKFEIIDDKQFVESKSNECKKDAGDHSDVPSKPSYEERIIEIHTKPLIPYTDEMPEKMSGDETETFLGDNSVGFEAEVSDKITIENSVPESNICKQILKPEGEPQEEEMQTISGALSKEQLSVTMADPAITEGTLSQETLKEATEMAVYEVMEKASETETKSEEEQLTLQAEDICEQNLPEKETGITNLSCHPKNAQETQEVNFPKEILNNMVENISGQDILHQSESTSAEPLTASYTDTLTSGSDVTVKVEVTSSVEISKENAETISDEQPHPTSSNADSDPLNAIEDSSGETISKEQPLESKTENYDEALLEHSNTTNNILEGSVQDLKQPETNTNAQSIYKEPLTASHTETLTNESDVTGKVEVTSSVEISKENAEAVSDEQLQAASGVAESTSLETEENPSGETVLKEQPSDSKADTSDKTLCEHSNTTNNTFEESAKVLNEQETNDQSTSAETLTASYTDTLTNGSDVTAKVEVTSSVEISNKNAETISDEQPHLTSSNADSDPLNAIEDSSGATISKEQPLKSKTDFSVATNEVIAQPISPDLPLNSDESNIVPLDTTINLATETSASEAIDEGEQTIVPTQIISEEYCSEMQTIQSELIISEHSETSPNKKDISATNKIIETISEQHSLNLIAEESLNLFTDHLDVENVSDSLSYPSDGTNSTEKQSIEIGETVAKTEGCEDIDKETSKKEEKLEESELNLPADTFCDKQYSETQTELVPEEHLGSTNNVTVIPTKTEVSASEDISMYKLPSKEPESAFLETKESSSEADICEAVVDAFSLERSADFCAKDSETSVVEHACSVNNVKETSNIDAISQEDSNLPLEIVPETITQSKIVFAEHSGTLNNVHQISDVVIFETPLAELTVLSNTEKSEGVISGNICDVIENILGTEENLKEEQQITKLGRIDSEERLKLLVQQSDLGIETLLKVEENLKEERPVKKLGRIDSEEGLKQSEEVFEAEETLKDEQTGKMERRDSLERLEIPAKQSNLGTEKASDEEKNLKEEHSNQTLERIDSQEHLELPAKQYNLLTENVLEVEENLKENQPIEKLERIGSQERLELTVKQSDFLTEKVLEAENYLKEEQPFGKMERIGPQERLELLQSDLPTENVLETEKNLTDEQTVDLETEKVLEEEEKLKEKQSVRKLERIDSQERLELPAKQSDLLTEKVLETELGNIDSERCLELSAKQSALETVEILDKIVVNSSADKGTKLEIMSSGAIVNKITEVILEEQTADLNIEECVPKTEEAYVKLSDIVLTDQLALSNKTAGEQHKIQTNLYEMEIKSNDASAEANNYVVENPDESQLNVNSVISEPPGIEENASIGFSEGVAEIILDVETEDLKAENASLVESKSNEEQLKLSDKAISKEILSDLQTNQIEGVSSEQSKLSNNKSNEAALKVEGNLEKDNNVIAKPFDSKQQEHFEMHVVVIKSEKTANVDQQLSKHPIEELNDAEEMGFPKQSSEAELNICETQTEQHQIVTEAQSFDKADYTAAHCGSNSSYETKSEDLNSANQSIIYVAANTAHYTDNSSVEQQERRTQISSEYSNEHGGAIAAQTFNDYSLDIIEEQTSSDDTPTATRQSTVVEKENSLGRLEENSPSGNLKISKKLQRQCRVVDTTPSFEDVSPTLMPQTSPPNTSSTLANLCQKFIHDKHLLTALENRRRRTLLMHRFLTTLDLSHSIDDSMEDPQATHTEVLVTQNPVVYESLTHSCHNSSEHDDCSDSFVLQTDEPNNISYNFINTILFSDQLSYESNPYDGSRTSTFEEYWENVNDEKDVLILNLNKLTTNTCLTANTNASSETNSNANTNSTRTKNFKHKRSVPRIRPPPPSDQRQPVNLLTSAIQNKDSSLTNTGLSFAAHLKNEQQVDVKMYKDENNYNEIDVGVGVGVGANSDFVGDNVEKHVDDDNNEDDDDDAVAIFRHFVPGSIAEREYKKWYNAVEMPNNPYAPEALKRRICGSQERFIDLPNISPTKDLNPLNLLSEPTMDGGNGKLENDYKRYSRDYYINSSVTTPQISPAKDPFAHIAKENREPPNATTKLDTQHDVYKAMPAQVVDEGLSKMEATKQTSTGLPVNSMSVSEDSDTIKFTDAAGKQQHDVKTSEIDAEEKASCSAVTKPESCGNVMAPTRGSTPVAFKFLQPKRKLLEPNQVLTVEDDGGPKIASSQLEKPVIEEEVAKALPSVKALARAFLMTTNATQPEKIWPRKARTLSQGGQKCAASPKRSLDQLTTAPARHKPEDDVTITSDLSSLETDSSSMGAELATSSNTTFSAGSSSKDPSNPDPIRQGVLKNNIAFFENLKNK